MNKRKLESPIINSKTAVYFSKSRAESIREGLESSYRLSESRILVCFIDKYIDCEYTALKLIQYYKSDNNKTFYSNTIRVDLLKNSIEHFGIDFSEDNTNRLFRSNGKAYTRGNRTVRQLRNKYLHGRSPNDVNEIINRYDDLTNLMDSWIVKIKDYFDI